MTLLLVLIASVAWSIHSYPRPRTVDRLKYAAGSQPSDSNKLGADAGSGAVREDPDRLRMDLFEGYQPTFTGYQRNVFQPIFVDRDTLLAREAAAAAERALRAAPPPPPVKPVAVPSAAQRELAGFIFHGFLEKDEGKIVFLERGDQIVLVKEGATFAGRYLAASLTDQVLVLRVTDTGEELVIPLAEGRSRHIARR